MWCAMWEDDDNTNKKEDHVHIHLSSVGFHVHCVGLVCHVVIAVGRLVVRLHHANEIPNLLLDVIVRLYLVNVNSDSITCCTSRTRVNWSVVLTPPVGYSKPLSAANDLSLTKKKSWKPSWEVFDKKTINNGPHRSLKTLLASCLTFWIVRRLPRVLIFPRCRRQTRCRLPLFVLPVKRSRIVLLHLLSVNVPR